MESFVVKGKAITSCIGNCPYFSVDSDRLMVCEHPKREPLSYKNWNTISTPQDGSSFPRCCPVAYPGAEKKREKDKLDKEQALRDMDEELKNI